ncbi:hypothetical protein IAQ61_009491 [Plenodomus lingam]|uniref:uncharacterized protein n=1 Tax=Leptosphaeria maculans TaxID=5022 RepID=UPI003322EAA1|nr:hypothetical protein IAQ61_009491 [Plenodomus lingam]
MVALQRVFVKAYWTLAGVGIVWAVSVGLLVVPWVQRHALYAHKFQTGLFGNVSNPEEFGFAKGQVQPFLLETADHEKLFCWHVIPLDVYLEHENELLMAAGSGEVAEGLKGTVGEKLMSGDAESRVVVNFHGNAGHIAQSSRPATYRSIVSIPKTHLLTCSYRGFGTSTLLNPPHLPTEPGLITDAISLLSYLHQTLGHPTHRTVLTGQSLGTAVTTAAALYAADPTSPLLPLSSLAQPPIPSYTGYAAIILVSPFRDLPSLLRTYKIAGLIPVLKPLTAYPRILSLLTSRIIDTWPTLPRLHALIDAHTPSSTPPRNHNTQRQNTPHQPPLHIHILHARNDPAITFRESEALFASLQSVLLAHERATAREERRSILGADRVARGAFAYRVAEVEGWVGVDGLDEESAQTEGAEARPRPATSFPGPRSPQCYRFAIDYKIGIRDGDPENELQKSTPLSISLAEKLSRGEKGTVSDPYLEKVHGKWQMYSSKGGFAPFEIPEFGSSEPIAVKTRSCCRRIKFWFAGDGYLRFQCKTGRIRKEAHRNAPTTTWSAVHMMQEHLKRECQDRMKQREKQQVERKLQAKKEEQQRRGESGTRFQEAKRKAAGKKGVEAWQSSQQ